MENDPAREFKGEDQQLPCVLSAIVTELQDEVADPAPRAGLPRQTRGQPKS